MRKILVKIFLCLGLAWIAATGLAQKSLAQDAATDVAINDHPLTGSASLSAYNLEAQKPVELKIQLQLPTGYRAYSDKFKIHIEEPEGFSYQNFKIEPLKQFYDETTKKNKLGIIGSAILTLPMEAPANLPGGDQKLRISITYQACTASYCLFPSVLKIETPFQFNSKVMQSSPIPLPFLKMPVAEVVSHGLALTFLMAFLAGFLTSLTPCIFPIIPITLAVLGRNAHLHSKRKNLLLAVFYVVGMALTYSFLGILAAATGSMFGSFINNPIVLSIVCVMFFVMAMSMFGAFELQAPLFIRQRFAGDLHLHGYRSAMIYGAIAGLVAGPCVGPVLVGILTYVAKTQNLWLGFWLLFVFALGMGQLFILLGFSSQFTKFLPKSGAWMNAVKNLFGYLMVAASFYYLSFLIQQRVWDGLLGVFLVGSASLLGAFAKIEHHSVAAKLNKGIQQALIFIGAALVLVAVLNLRPLIENRGGSGASAKGDSAGELQWGEYSEAAMATAKSQHHPVLIDFWADWCTACKELDSITFESAAFKAAAKSFVLLKFDSTNETDQLKLLREKYNLVGLPSLLLFNAQGEWQADLTTTEFIEAPALVEKMKKLGSQ